MPHLLFLCTTQTHEKVPGSILTSSFTEESWVVQVKKAVKSTQKINLFDCNNLSYKLTFIITIYCAVFKEGFFGLFLFMYDIQHCFICRHSDSTVSEDAGIEPRTGTTTALAVRRSNHLARSHLISFAVLYYYTNTITRGQKT